VKRIVTQTGSEEVVRVVRATLLNEIGNYMSMCSRVIQVLAVELERKIRQLPIVEMNMDKIYNDSRELSEKIIKILADYESDKDKEKEAWYSFAVILAVIAVANSVLTAKSDSILNFIAEFVQAELGGVEL